ncbi:MAG: ATP-binding protein, partial [Thermoleophilaceae bacterium]
SAPLDVIGDTVTVAEKLEAAAALDTVLVSESTRTGAADAFEWEPMPDLAIQGSSPIRTFRPVRIVGQTATAVSSGTGDAKARGHSRSLQVEGVKAHVLEEERKIVTVLFADISSSEPLSARLAPARLREVLGSYFGVLARAIQHHGGTIDRYIGDAVMAVFGAPISHEDDAARAVSAALAIQRGAGPLGAAVRSEHGIEIAIRIGINTGEVVAGLLPGEVHAYTVTGDAVVTAQRIESVAPPQTVLVSESTRALAQKAFVFEAVAPLKLKGKAEAVPAYRVIGPERRASPRSGASIIGRESELERLFAFYREAAAGRGQVVHVEGEPGIGKTRLVAELLTQVGTQAGRLRSRAASYEQATPYALVADIVRRLFTVPADEPEPTARAALETGLAGVVEPAAIEASAIVLLEVLGYDTRSPLDAQGRRRLVLSVLRRALEARAVGAPLILLLEDLHWVDPTSAGLLAEVASSVPQLRCLFLSTARVGSELAWQAERLALSALPTAAAYEMIDQLTPTGLDDPTRALILERTAGNPFFIEEVVRSLKDGKTGVVPATVQELLEARLDTLDASPRRVVQRAAVIGRIFARSVLECVAAQDDLDAALGTLTRERFVDEIAPAPEPVYSFLHALVQEVAYRTQLISQRRRGHVAVGDAYSDLFSERLEDYVDTLAFHYRRGDDDPKARTWLLRAGRRAQRLYATAEALDYLRDAVARSAEDAIARAEAYEGIGDVLHVTSAYEDAIASYGTALECRGADAVEVRARLLRKTGVIRHLQGRTDSAVETFQNVLRELPAEAAGERAKALLHLGEILWRSGEYRDATARLTEAVAEAERAGDDDARAEALKQLGTAYVVSGDLATGLRYYEESLALYERLGDVLGQANVHSNIGLVRRRESRHRDAIESYERALAIRERIGDQNGSLRSHNNIGEASYLLGDLDTAEASFRRALAIAQTIGYATGVALARLGVGAALVQRGAADEGIAELKEAILGIEAIGNRTNLFDAIRDLTDAYLEHEPAAAREWADRAMQLAEQLGAPDKRAIALQLVGRAMAAEGDLERGAAPLEESQSLLRAGRDRQELGRTLAALAIVYEALPAEDPRRAQAPQLRSEARSIFSDLGAALDLRRLDAPTSLRG